MAVDEINITCTFVSVVFFSIFFHCVEVDLGK